MVSNPTEYAEIAAAAESCATLTIDRGPVSLRCLYLPNVAEAQDAYDFASAVARRSRGRNFGAAVHLCTLARMDVNECVERVVIRGGLLHIGVRGLRA
ncbi:hypothetical protein [Pseudorhodoferax sp. Leaf274]|uniref:hypothetical protein n=1 Tax=Pseudorhodoferax sp. Leaf274 TaxID=1736318 RepID=UPI000703AE83|nr:hypothetical protein [Pseudorhodoferax sp. Leaf274]KQP43939.1 hypothetical protein ASF44_28850 [Pseudorhodoferax sp. Leaf274]